MTCITFNDLQMAPTFSFTVDLNLNLKFFLDRFQITEMQSLLQNRHQQPKGNLGQHCLYSLELSSHISVLCFMFRFRFPSRVNYVSVEVCL